MSPPTFKHSHEYASVAVLDLLMRLDQLQGRSGARASLLTNYLRKVLNTELELLATCAYELEFDPEVPEVKAALRTSTERCAVTVASVMKRKFAKLCRDHQELE